MKNKLSPIEELRAEKQLLRNELHEQESRFSSSFSYIRNNWTSILFSSIFSYSVNSIKNAFGLGIKEDKGNSSFLDKLLVKFPILWNFAEPFVIGFATKKLSKFFLKKKRK